MKKTIFIKTFGGYVLILVSLAALFLIFSFRTSRSHYLKTLTNHLEHVGISLAPQVISHLEKGQIEEMDGLLKGLGKRIGVRITVVDQEGVVLADSEEDPARMENHRYRPEIFEALQGRTGSSLRYSNTVREKMLYVGIPLEKGGLVAGVLRTSLFLREINSLLTDLRRNIALAVAFIIGISLAAAFFFSRSLTRPIGEIVRAMQRVAAGDFQAKLSFHNKDEMEEFGANFNAMTARLRTLFTDLAHQKEEMEGIIASIREGLLVLDKDGKILLSNESFRRILQTESAAGRYYWEVVRASRFLELVKKIQEQKSSLAEEISLGESRFFCSASFLPSQERIVMTIHDLTDMENLNRMKKDFVLNVSHELRTPLTAIKGFVEALEEHVDEKGRSDLAVIRRNTERLIGIVQDLLALSELEEKGIEREQESVDLKSLVENVFRIFEAKAGEKNITLQVRVEGPLAEVKGDAFRLEQMFVNLIDNAVKYTEKGAATVVLKPAAGGVLIEVQDTGIGISRDYLLKIFERFYVVDRSRSRKLGGTGLGLSLVKHIVLLHGGKVHVESEEGRGTKFVIFLPGE